MGSLSNSENLWPPPIPNAAAFSDCSQGICSIYCPQWCYIIYSPPPPFIHGGEDGGSSSSAFKFSPFIVAVIGILATTFIILIIYHTVISRLCRTNDDNPTSQRVNSSSTSTDELDSTHGLDETVINSIMVCKYNTDGGGHGGGDCCVCLGEFEENESLRLLPKCNHAFHLPCIDTWLKSHSTCPLCRSSVDGDVIGDNTAIIEVPTINALEWRSDATVIVHSSYQQCLQQVLVVSA